MHRLVERWIMNLTALDVDEALFEFETWLNVESRFPTYSVNNTILILLQRPAAMYLASYDSWINDFGRHVLEGEKAIWIWVPIIAKRCPACGNSLEYHTRMGCDFDDTSPRMWEKGAVGFKPVPVFDISQTEGTPFPASKDRFGEMPDVHENSEVFVQMLIDEASSLDLAVRTVSPNEWSHPDTLGVCNRRCLMTLFPLIEVVDGHDEILLARTLLGQYARGRLAFDIDEEFERAMHEFEAKSAASIVERHFGIEDDEPLTGLGSWESDDLASVQSRLNRINHTAKEFITTFRTAFEMRPEFRSDIV